MEAIAASTYPACVKYEGNDIKQINVTSTLIKSILRKREIKENICPRKLYETYLTANRSTIPSNDMQNGLFFESLALGAGRTGKLFDLERLKNGNKSTDQLRIEEQVKMFSMVAKHYGLTIYKAGHPQCNVQVEAGMPVEFKEYPDIKIILKAGLDIVSPIKIPGTEFDYPMAVTDIKLALNRDNEHGDFCWGLPQYLDLTQAVLYSTVTKLPFFYLIFDYKSKNRGHKIIPVETLAMDAKSIVGKSRLQDLKISVKTTIEQVIKMDYDGYEAIPTYDECQNCPINPLYPGGTCDKANAMKTI